MDFLITAAEGGGVLVSVMWDGEEYTIHLDAVEALLIARQLVECAEEAEGETKLQTN